MKDKLEVEDQQALRSSFNDLHFSTIGVLAPIVLKS